MRGLESDKAKRIVAAMRASVARRGAQASTFDHVATEAGVSRGLVHYYFGSKERLLIEVVRSDAEIRMQRLADRLQATDCVDAIVDTLVAQLEEFVAEETDTHALTYEMFVASRHNDEIHAAMADLYRKLRSKLAAILSDKHRQGVACLKGDAEGVASVLLALGDGLTLQLLADPGRRGSASVDTGVTTARFLLGG